MDSYQEVNYDISCFFGVSGKCNYLAEGAVFVVPPAAFSAAREALDDFNVAIAELSQTEAVVSSLVLGYMFLDNKIERMVRGK